MFLTQISLENVFSFGTAERLALRPLNVLIGQNASGKSNLIRAIGLIRALPNDLSGEIAKSGGIRAWINQKTSGVARIALESQVGPFYKLALREIAQSYEIVEEKLSNLERNGNTFRLPLTQPETGQHIDPRRSVLAEIRTPGKEGTNSVANAFAQIRLYREFRTGPLSSARNGISASAFGDYLDEDGSNLALVVSKMQLLNLSDEINVYLQRFFEDFEKVFAHPSGGISQTFVRERGLSDPMAATSLSDGTLRLLCLLTVLLDPAPPPLICIEEPEVGLHPDAIRIIAELLTEAATRTQLIVTTHSPALIDALGDQPESVVVCERDFDGFTRFRRLQSADLDKWMERYSLGQLWQKGEIGGNRW